MAKTQAIFALVTTWCFLLALPLDGRAQILDQALPQSSDGVQQAGGLASSAEEDNEVERVGWFNIPLPKITMPKLTMPKMPPLWPSGANDKSPALFAPVAAGFNKISSGTRKAWEGTKEVFAAGTKKSPRSAQPRPSLWQRLVGPPAEPAVPQTVGEFMSQPRLDP